MAPIGDRDPFKILSTTRSTIDDMGWEGLGQSVIGTVILAVVFGFIDVFNAFLEIFTALFGVLATIVPQLNEATFGGIAGFIGQSFDAGANAFGRGFTGLLGPLQAPFGVAVALLVLWEVLYFLDVVNSDFLGFVVDLPVIDSDESAAAGDEGE